MSNNNSTVEQVEQPISTHIYSKFNPLLIKKIEKSKKMNFWFSVARFTLAIFSLIMLLLSLFYASEWSSSTLEKINVDVNKLAESAKVTLPTIDGVNVLSTLGLFEFSSSSFNQNMLSSLITIGFMTIFVLIPVLVFKNGTLMSLLFNVILFAFVLTITILFFMGIAEQMEIIKPYKSWQNLGSPESTESAELAKQILNNIWKGAAK